MKPYVNKWVKLRTAHGPVRIEERLLQKLEHCRSKKIPLVMPTTSAFFDAFRFAWTVPDEPTEKEWKLMAEVIAGIKLMTLNAPDAGRVSDMEFEKQMENTTGADYVKKAILDAGGVIA